MAKKKEEGEKVVVTNRKARFAYEILETFEAGLELKGPEVKSLRAGQASFEGAFARVNGAQVWLHNLYIAPYKQNTTVELDSRRDRKLLLHKREIKKIKTRTEGKGLTVVPLDLKFRRGWAKLTIALARGKTGADKRESLQKKQESRELERSFKGKFRV